MDVKNKCFSLPGDLQWPTFLSPSWRSPVQPFQRVTFSPPQKGHKQNCQVTFVWRKVLQTPHFCCWLSDLRIEDAWKKVPKIFSQMVVLWWRQFYHKTIRKKSPKEQISVDGFPLTNIFRVPFSSMPFPKSCEIRVRFFCLSCLVCSKISFFVAILLPCHHRPPKKKAVDTTHFVVEGSFLWNREAHAKIEVVTMVKFKLKPLPTLHALQGSLYCQPKQCIIQIHQNYHTFTLILPKMGTL